MATKEELDLVERELEMAERKEALEGRKLQNKKLRKELQKDEMTEANKTAVYKERGEALRLQLPENKHKAVRSRCTHLMGGVGRNDLINGAGDSAIYAVSKVKLPTGDVQIRCNRCRKTWIPAYEPNFYFDKNGKFLAKEQGGKLDRDKFNEAVSDYNRALNWRSLAMAVCPQYQFKRGDETVNREVTQRYVVGSK